MNYDKNLVAGKLRRWDRYLDRFHLPAWSEIPDIGLYMEQVVVLLKQYLDYLPPELKEEQLITSATINNYVRTKIMPEPKKKAVLPHPPRLSHHHLHAEAEPEHRHDPPADSLRAV